MEPRYWINSIGDYDGPCPWDCEDEWYRYTIEVVATFRSKPLTISADRWKALLALRELECDRWRLTDISTDTIDGFETIAIEATFEGRHEVDGVATPRWDKEVTGNDVVRIWGDLQAPEGWEVVYTEAELIWTEKL